MENTLEHTYLRSEEVMDLLRVSRSTLQRMIAAGTLRPARLPSGMLRFRASDVTALLDPDDDDREAA